MKEEVKKKLTIIIGIFFVLCVILIILAAFGKKEKVSPLKELDDDEKFFSIQTTINNTIDDEDIDYIITKILCKEYKNTSYCFINGYSIEYPELSDLVFNDNVSYQLILKGNTYSFKEIKTTNIEEYAKNYNEYEELTNGKILAFIDYSEKNKLSSYISNFINLTMFNQKEARKLLKNNTSELPNLSSNIISYKKESNTYTIKDSNNNTFKIIEKSTMNYLIEI